MGEGARQSAIQSLISSAKIANGPHYDSTRIRCANFRRLSRSLARGSSESSCGQTAALVADSLVASNLRAVDSHGVQLLGFYIEQIRAGNFDVHARGSRRVASELGRDR